MTRRIDVLGAPEYGRPGLAIDERAAWYVDRANGHLIRVDLGTERRAFLRTPGFGALTTSVVSLDGMIYFGTEGGFEKPGALSVIDAEAAAVAAGG